MVGKSSPVGLSVQEVGRRRGELVQRPGAVDQDARVRLWRSMVQDLELSWLKDAPAHAAQRIIEVTLRKMREDRTREEGWRMFFSGRAEV